MIVCVVVRVSILLCVFVCVLLWEGGRVEKRGDGVKVKHTQFVAQKVLTLKTKTTNINVCQLMPSI